MMAVEIMPYDVDYETRLKLLEVAIWRLGKAQTLNEVIELVRTAARSICSADGVTFVLRRNGFCHYVEEDAIAPLWKGQMFPMEHCISGWAMLNNKTVAIGDVFADPRIPQDAYRRTFVKSLIMAPLGADEPIAAMGAYWGEPRHFSGRDIAVMDALAKAVSDALRSVRAVAPAA